MRTCYSNFGLTARGETHLGVLVGGEGQVDAGHWHKLAGMK